ncbi:MAG: carboxypeptidase regulatory-like domain-containing protein, partial [Phycisphaerales bacterium]
MLGKKMTFLWAGLVVTFSIVRLSTAWGQEGRVVQGSLAQSNAGERIMDFHAIHRQTREPLSKVALTIRITGENYRRRESWDDKTDSQGLCRVRLPDFQIETLQLYPRKEGFVPLFIMWRGIPTPPELPKAFTVAMEPSTTIGGVVRDELGEPIEGVAVGVHYQTADPDAAENVHADVMIHNAHSTDIETDKAGRWTFDEMPAEIDKNELRIFLMHPGYLSDRLRPGHIPLPITRQPSIEKLRDLSAAMVMKEGLEVAGKVSDKQGNPVAGAKIYDTEDYWWRSTKPFAETDTRGQFRSNTNPGTATWTIQAPGYAPDLRVVTIKGDMPPVEIRLEPGRVIEGKVTDQAGKPIEGASIRADTWRRNRGRLHLEAKTDAEGNFKVTDAPADEISFDIGKQGHMMLEKYAMKAGELKYSITLRPTLKVRGTVLDVQTGEPINKFTVTNGFDFEDGRAPQWDKNSVRTFTGGQYEMEYRQEIFTYRIRIDAEGYQSAVSDCIRPTEIAQSNVIFDFSLDKAAPVTGTVLSPDGTPLSGADVVIATHRLRIANGKVDSRSSEHNLILHTDADGRFRFEPLAEPYVVVVLGERGCAKVTPHEFAASRTITVSPWGRIEGTLRIGAQPGADRFVAFLHESNRQQERPRMEFDYETRTDKNGRFVLTRVLPGEGVVTRAIPIGARARRFSHSIGVEVKSSRTTRVQIGGTGRPVVGKVVIPDMIEKIFDWQYTDHRLRISSPDSRYQILALEFDKDGSFRAEDVPAGDYCIYVYAYGPPPNSRSRWGERIGELSRVFTIPKMPGGRSDETLDLGELELQVVGMSAPTPSPIGKPLPDLGGMKIDFAPAQAPGKMILVCFFDMSQRPSRNCLRQLSARAQELKAQDVVVFAIQVLKIDKSALNEWVKTNNIPFPTGMVHGDEEEIRFAWGVKS